MLPPFRINIKANAKFDTHKCGSMIWYSVDGNDVSMPPYEVFTIDGYESPINAKTGQLFPYCCNFHQSIYDNSILWLVKFPYCCKNHQEIAKNHHINKDDYKSLPMKIVQQISYTEYHISKTIDNPDWYKDITNYIEYNISSFGHP